MHCVITKYAPTRVLVPIRFKVTLRSYFNPVWNHTPPTSACSFDPILVSRVENYILEGVVVCGKKDLFKELVLFVEKEVRGFLWVSGSAPYLVIGNSGIV